MTILLSNAHFQGARSAPERSVLCCSLEGTPLSPDPVKVARLESEVVEDLPQLELVLLSRPGDSGCGGTLSDGTELGLVLLASALEP
jgi:hypothetical protein